MSEKSVRSAETVLNQLLKAKGTTRELIADINRAESGLNRLSYLASSLARGDPTALITYLATMGPTGLKLAVALGIATVAYGVYSKLTEEKPTELYFWRYPQ